MDEGNFGGECESSDEIKIYVPGAYMTAAFIVAIVLENLLVID